jgi:hypothetical protein
LADYFALFDHGFSTRLQVEGKCSVVSEAWIAALQAKSLAVARANRMRSKPDDHLMY